MSWRGGTLVHLTVQRDLEGRRQVQWDLKGLQQEARCGFSLPLRLETLALPLCRAEVARDGSLLYLGGLRGVQCREREREREQCRAQVERDASLLYKNRQSLLLLLLPLLPPPPPSPPPAAAAAAATFFLL
jgi:hypothetical protein